MLATIVYNELLIFCLGILTGIALGLFVSILIKAFQILKEYQEFNNK